MPTPSLLIVPARFKSGKMYSQIPTSGDGDFTVTRATTATRVGPDGLIASVASGIPRLDYFASGGVTGCPALLVEPSAQNLALHSRDLSVSGSWTASGITAVRNAAGADGTTSGATTLTATAASGTVLQALSHASQSRVFSAYVRRVTGTGAIQMTTNGGTNWTTVTISSLYTQVACDAQTVASGTVGFRMAVSGDVIEVDFTQGEVGPAFTSPIPTTTGSVTRNADVISVTGAVSGSIGATEGTIYVEVDISKSFTNSARIVSISDGGATNRIDIYRTTGSKIEYNITAPLVSIFRPSSGTYIAPIILKIAVAYKSGDSRMYINGVAATTSHTATFTFSNPLTNIYLGATPFGTLLLNDRIRAVALYTTRLTDTELAALTAP